MKSLEDRMNELEMRYTEQEDTVQKLSEVIRAQQLVIDGLVASQKRSTERIEGLIADYGSDVPNEKPPHY